MQQTPIRPVATVVASTPLAGGLYGNTMTHPVQSVVSTPSDFQVVIDSLRKETSEFRRYDLLLPQVASLGHVTYYQALTLLELFTMSTTRDDVLKALRPGMSVDDLRAIGKAKVTSGFQQQILLDSLLK